MDERPEPRPPRPVRARTFRRLDERSRTHAPLPLATASGGLLGALGGASFLCIEAAVSAMAGLALPPVEQLHWVLLAGAGVGAGLGATAGLAGLWGSRWASAAATTGLGWLVGGQLAVAFASSGGPGALGLMMGVVGGAGLGQLVGRAPTSATVHLGGAAFVFTAAATAGPVLEHVLSSVATPLGFAVVVTACGVGALGAGVALLLSGSRPPVLPLVASGLVGAGVAGWAGPEVATLTWASSEGKSAPIVLVVVSGMRWDRTGPGGYRRPVTPSLDRFAQSAVRFDQARATSNWTVPSLGSILTGRLPYAHGAGLNDGRRQRHTPLRPDVQTLASVLRRSGWSTAASIGDPRLRGYWLDAGFQRWVDTPYRGTLPVLLHPVVASGLDATRWPDHVGAETVTDRARGLMAQQSGGSWFLMVQYADAAGPLRPRSSDETALGFTSRSPREDLYDAALHRVDSAFGTLMEAVPDNAWVVVVADRGAHLSDERTDASQGRVGAMWGHTMYDELLRVPLWVRAPGRSGREISQGVSMVDLTPTLLAAAGLDPLHTSDGLVLDGAFGGSQTARAAIAQSSYWGVERQAAIVDRHKVVAVATGSTPMYDLARDPAETAPLRAAPELDLLERQLLALLPPAGAGVELHDPPSLTLRLGRLLTRFASAFETSAD